MPPGPLAAGLATLLPHDAGGDERKTKWMKLFETQSVALDSGGGAPPLRALEGTISALMLGGARPRALQSLYRDLDDTSMLSDMDTEKAYRRIATQLKRCVEERMGALAPPAASDAAACGAWALALRDVWRECVERLERVVQLAAPVLGSAWYKRHAEHDLEALCFEHAQQQVLKVMRAEDVLIQGVVQLVQEARDEDEARAQNPAEPEPEDQDADALRAPCAPLPSLLALAERMGIGRRLGNALAEHALKHAEGLAALYADAIGPLLPRIAACLARERRWAAWMYAMADQAHVPAKMQAVLVTQHADALVGTLPALIEAQDTARMLHLYTLLRDARRTAPLRAALGQYVKDKGMRLVQGPEDTLISGLLEFQHEMHALLHDAFEGDAELNHAIRDSFEVFVNARDSKPAELLARFADAKLRAGNKIMSDAELEACMTQVLALFRFMHDKDMFEEFYKRYFAKRLLLSRSASDDAERSMLLKLKDECGPDFTAKLETMLKDMQLSDGLMAAYAERGAALPFDFEVSVLTQAHWPTFPEAHASLPQPMLDAMDGFASFYKTCHSGRTLHWRHSLGFLVVTADLGKAGVRELHISTFQAAVLFVFNGWTPGETISYADIRARTGLEDKELKRTLQSLACGTIPTRVLRKHPQGRDVSDTDTFSLNEALKNERRRIRINQIQHKDTKEEQRSTEERVFIDRELILQAAAMRILKAKKVIKHAELTTEVVQQIKNRFAVDASELKKAFERLIEKDCMERVEGKRGVYRYVA